MGECAITWQRAPRPHAPSHGSRQRRSMHANCNLHSALTRHSGRQEGGDPICPGLHEQAAAPLGLTVHSLYGPHGDGEHGETGSKTLNCQ